MNLKPKEPAAALGTLYLCPRCQVPGLHFDHDDDVSELRCPKCQTTLALTWPADKRWKESR